MADKPSDWAKAQGLTGRTTKRLAQYDIETERDFMSLDEETVMGWKQTGKTVWDEIKAHQEKLDGGGVEEDEGETEEAGEAPADWDPLLGPAPTKSEPATEDDSAEEEKPKRRRRRSKSEEDEDETDTATEAAAPPEDEDKPKRGRRRKSSEDVPPQGSNGDSVVGLINWAIDAAAYDKKLCRDLLVKAREKLAGS